MFGKNEIVGQKLFSDAGDKLMVTSMFMTLQGEGPFSGQPAFFVRLAKCQLACHFCFPDYYQVTTDKGVKKLRDIKPGDRVMTMDDNLLPAWTTVQKTNGRRVLMNEMRRVTYKLGSSEDSIICTADHPFHVKGRGFIPADNLQPGMVVHHFVTNGAEVISVTPVPPQAHSPISRGGSLSNGEVSVVNLTCHPYNTFLMKGLHVHNCDTYFDDGDWFSVTDLESEIENRIAIHYNNHVPEWMDWDQVPFENYPLVKDDRSISTKRRAVFVLTGGEPMLQQNIVPLLERMNHQFENTQVESNGILLQDIPQSTTLVVSPKCREKKGEPVEYIKPPDKTLQRANCLKFLITAEEGPYHTVPTWALQASDSLGIAIYISPMNEYLRYPAAAQKLRQEKNKRSIDDRSEADEVISFWEEGLLDMEKNRRNHEYAAQYAITHGLYLSLQQHLYASLP